MSKPPQRFVDDPTSHDGLREALELSAEAPCNYDTDKGLARLQAGLIALPAGLSRPDVPDASPAPQAAGIASVSALWWGLAAVGAAGGLLGGYYAWQGDDASTATESAETPAQAAVARIQTPQPQVTPTVTPTEAPARIRSTVNPVDGVAATATLAEGADERGRARPSRNADRAAHTGRPQAATSGQPSHTPEPTTTSDDPLGDDDVMRREIAQLAATRRALRESPTRALTLAREGQREFPNGMFGEERAALAIFALGELGRDDEAQREARQFLRSYPNGPFSARVRQLSAP